MQQITPPIKTGETNLQLNKELFIAKVLENDDGLMFLDAISSESRILERQGLIHGYFEDDMTIVFDIPNWDALMYSAYAFAVSYIPPEDEENND